MMTRVGPLLAILPLLGCPKPAPVPEPVPVAPSTPGHTIQGAPPSASSNPQPAYLPQVFSADGPGVKWEAKVGLTTYRTTILVHGGMVIAGSNGEGFQQHDDPMDGVWLLDAMSGALRAHLVPPGQGEKDVNGIALDGNQLVFGTDQGVVYRATMDGSVLWWADIGGDAEAAPGLYDANGDGVLDVAIGAEHGDFHVLDGRNGEPLFTIPTSTGEYDQTGFVAPPALFDVTGDGVRDVFAPGRDNWLHAVDGRSGEPLWSNQHTSGLHGAPVITDTNHDGVPELIYTEAYSNVHAVDPLTGRELWGASLQHPDGGVEGLFSAVTWHPRTACALLGTAWWDDLEGLYCVGPEGVYWRWTEPTGNVTSGAVIGEVDGKQGLEVVFGTESGRLLALDDSGQAVWTVQVGAPIECTPTLADIDGDGLIEILVASNDGYLRAYDTRGKAPALLGYHRGSTWNQGVLFHEP